MRSGAGFPEPSKTDRPLPPRYEQHQVPQHQRRIRGLTRKRKEESVCVHAKCIRANAPYHICSGFKPLGAFRKNDRRDHHSRYTYMEKSGISGPGFIPLPAIMNPNIQQRRRRRRRWKLLAAEERLTHHLKEPLEWLLPERR